MAFRTRGFFVLLIGMMPVATATKLGAQNTKASERTSEALRRRCQPLQNAWLDELSTYRSVMAQLRGCDETGPVVLVRAWRTAPDDTARLRTLAVVSAFMPDDRVVQAVIPLMRDRTVGPLRRSAALAVLESILLGGGIPRVNQQSTLTGGVSITVASAVADFSFDHVAEPLRPGTRQHVVDIPRVMARDTTEERWFRWTAGGILVAAGEKAERE